MNISVALIAVCFHQETNSISRSLLFMHEDNEKRTKERAPQSVCDRDRLVVLFRAIIPKTKQRIHIHI